MPISAESEVLTLNGGWKFVKNVTCEDEIACACAGLQKQSIPVFEYKKPYKIERVEFDGTICHLQNQQLNLLVTGDQRLWVCDCDCDDKYEFHDAIDVVGKAVRFMKFGELDSEYPINLNKETCKQIISEALNLNDFPSSRYSQIAFHAGYSIDTFIETNCNANRNRRSTQLDREVGSAFFDIYDNSSFYSFELSHNIPMYNLSIQDVDLIYVQRHGRACWIGI